MKKLTERDIQPFLDTYGKWTYAWYRISDIKDFSGGLNYIAMLLREEEEVPWHGRLLIAELIDSKNHDLDIKLVPKKTHAQTKKLQKTQTQRLNTIEIEAKMRREGLSKFDAIGAFCDQLRARGKKRSERQLERDMKAERDWRAKFAARKLTCS